METINQIEDFTVETLGPLMLWDNRVELLLKKAGNFHPETTIYDYLSIERPNIYAVHSVKYNNRIIPLISYVYFEFETSLCEVAILGLVCDEHSPSPSVMKKVGEIVRDYVRNEVAIVLDEILIGVSAGSTTYKKPYSSSFSTLSILAIERQEVSNT